MTPTLPAKAKARARIAPAPPACSTTPGSWISEPPERLANHELDCALLGVPVEGRRAPADRVRARRQRLGDVGDDRRLRRRVALERAELDRDALGVSELHR